MKKIAVLTSGGDAPGMNAAIRAVVRAGLHHGYQVFGVKNGFAGLLSANADDIKSLSARDVGGIIQKGGTFLGTARCPEFKSEEGRKKALLQLTTLGINALIVIGGNGSQSGSYALWKMGLPVVGIASTIDNDLMGTDHTIGTDTALNISLEAIDRLKVTASSHRRAFVLEVMGRDCGHIALMTGIAGGAEVIIVPEVETNPEEVVQEVKIAYQRGKSHALIVVAEGARYNAKNLEKYFKESEEDLGFELRLSILGHVQRGGIPSIFDRMLATRYGVAAVDSVVAQKFGVLIGTQQGQIKSIPLQDVVGQIKRADLRLLEMAKILSL